jgi:hypothetical protein
MNSRRFIDQLKWHARRNVGAVAAPAWLRNPAAITLPVPWDPALASAMGPVRGKRSLNMGHPSLLRLLFFCPVLGAEGGLVKKENSVASDVATPFFLPVVVFGVDGTAFRGRVGNGYFRIDP